MNNAIITVVGSDKVGIIAKVSTYLSEHKVNIVDITQTILSGNFVMMMMVDLSSASVDIDNLRKDLSKKAEEMGVEINIMSEKVFTAMHRV
ncbi:MAG: ACT domain-containing protein [Treponema sp.]|nr:ACT domain-containing protein [Spirochaetia bacterium]MDY2839387.1 ACT domain-containing protein [Treponema sp.]MDY5122541.1 ACT domain-containing protein [Treponema sp.]